MVRNVKCQAIECSSTLTNKLHIRQNRLHSLLRTVWVQCQPQKAMNGFSCSGKESRGEGKVPAGVLADGSWVLVVMLQYAQYRHDHCFKMGFGLRDGQQEEGRECAIFRPATCRKEIQQKILKGWRSKRGIQARPAFPAILPLTVTVYYFFNTNAIAMNSIDAYECEFIVCLK